MSQVLQYATLRGWLVYHTHDSRRSAAGFPDLCMVRTGRLVFAELKRDRKAKATDEQAKWMAELKAVWGAVGVYLWTPDDWELIEKVLQ